ncbi:MAG: hypothetical protein FWE71_17395 [Nocardioidaceae bacterium]|nr:hypothetical protein [Nocardioidaceae bacterium]MCL2611970.1 hypothetical protein [Nocardioidaceae bacterium]
MSTPTPEQRAEFRQIAETAHFGTGLEVDCADVILALDKALPPPRDDAHRREGSRGRPEHLPAAPDGATSEPAVDEASDGQEPAPQDVQQRAGEASPPLNTNVPDLYLSVLNHEVASSKDLTEADARRVIEALNAPTEQ